MCGGPNQIPNKKELQVALIELILSLAAILLAAVLFTNAIEILGSRLQMGQGAVGSILAAVGTALPETMIAIVAIVGAAITGSGAGAEIGVGAILGAPFLLTTIAMFVVGASALGFRQQRANGSELRINRGVTRRDVGFFFIFFAIAAAAGLVALPIYVKIMVGLVLVGAYVLYVRQTLIAGGTMLEEVPEKLKLWPSSWGNAPTWAVVSQNLGALLVMGAGAHFFVEAIEHGSEAVGIPPGLVALILAPLATELPEKFNSVIWLRQDKDTLAFGNITGAMVFQSTIPVSIGILLTPWSLDAISIFSVALALTSGAALFVLLRRKAPLNSVYLLGGGLFYLAFVVAAIFAVL